MAECTRTVEPEGQLNSTWKLFVDGSVTTSATGVGIVLKDPGGFNYEYVLKLQFPVTHNTTEYEAMLIGLRLAHTMEAKELAAYSNFQLVIQQIQGEYEGKEPSMRAYLD